MNFSRKIELNINVNIRIPKSVHVRFPTFEHKGYSFLLK